jgi:hypothetical protein
MSDSTDDLAVQRFVLASDILLGPNRVTLLKDGVQAYRHAGRHRVGDPDHLS